MSKHSRGNSKEVHVVTKSQRASSKKMKKGQLRGQSKNSKIDISNILGEFKSYHRRLNSVRKSSSKLKNLLPPHSDLVVKSNAPMPSSKKSYSKLKQRKLYQSRKLSEVHSKDRKDRLLQKYTEEKENLRSMHKRSKSR
jgi:hypothetical protein